MLYLFKLTLELKAPLAVYLLVSQWAHIDFYESLRGQFAAFLNIVTNYIEPDM